MKLGLTIFEFLFINRLQDHTNCKDRVQGACSDHGSVTTKSNGKHESQINYVGTGCSGSSKNIGNYGTTLKHPFQKCNFVEVFSCYLQKKTLLKFPDILRIKLQENNRNLCILGAGAGSSDASRQAMIQQQQQNGKIPSASCLGSKLVNSSLETYRQSSVSSCNSPPVAGVLLNDGKSLLRYSVLPTSRSYNDGFATSSLDRRAVKERFLLLNSAFRD